MAGEIIFGIRLKIDGKEAVGQIAAARSEVEKLVQTAQKRAPDPTTEIRKGAVATRSALSGLTQALGGLVSLGAISRFVRQSVQEFARAEAAFRGLEAVANFSGVGIGRAMAEAERLAADGLITVQEASRGLQNLLSRGYSIEQAVTTLERLKDAAAFNRQAHLSMGEAVVSATEGLKNENSVLVDNAGVTKNVSKMWEEYARRIGKSVTELTQAEKITAEYNGILAETEAQKGNAAKASNTIQGAFARLSAETQKFAALLGKRLAPAMSAIASLGVGMIENFFKPFLFFADAARIRAGQIGQAIGRLIDLVKTRDVRAFIEGLRADAALAEQMLIESAAELQKGTPQFEPLPDTGRRRAPEAPPPPKPRSLESLLSTGRDEIQRLQQRMRAELDVLKAGLEAATNVYEGAYQDQQIELEAYYVARRAIVERGEAAERSEIERSISALEAERTRVLKLRGKDADERAKIQERAADLANQIEVARLALQKLDIETSSALAELARKEQQDRYQRIEQAMSRAQAIVQATEQSLQSRVIVGLETEATARQKLRHAIGEQGRALEQELLPRIQALMEITSDPKRLAELQAVTDKIREMIETGRDKSWLDGVQSGLKEYATAVADIFQIAKDAVGRAFRSMEDALVRFVTTGKANFRDLADSIISDLARIAIQRGITQPLADFIGPLFSSFAASLFHRGGIVGEHASTRAAPAAAFLGAPRLHSGGILAPDEVPAILRRGEAVFTPGQLAALGRVTVNVINNTPAQVRTQEREDRGERVIDVIIEQVTGLMGRDIARGAGLAPLLERRYGLSPAAGALR